MEAIGVEGLRGVVVEKCGDGVYFLHDWAGISASVLDDKAMMIFHLLRTYEGLLLSGVFLVVSLDKSHIIMHHAYTCHDTGFGNMLHAACGHDK